MPDRQNDKQGGEIMTNKHKDMLRRTDRMNNWPIFGLTEINSERN